MRVGVLLMLAAALFLFRALPLTAQQSPYNSLANAPFSEGFLRKGTIAALKDELIFERAVQSYL